jgi:hypothetical protein
MKKMWIVAAIACAALMVSCGGEKKNDKLKNALRRYKDLEIRTINGFYSH